MKISAITVCVNYADYLQRVLPVWLPGLASLTVISSHQDAETRKYLQTLKSPKVRLLQTSLFYKNGAMFNKGAALQSAIDQRHFTQEWCLFFDADIQPPDDWHAQVVAASPQLGNLYWANRLLEDGSMVTEDTMPCGYFQLFNRGDPVLQRRPWLESRWKHAGNYDSRFAQRWKADQYVKLPFTVLHYGKPWQNWCGRGNTKAMDALFPKRPHSEGSKPQAGTARAQ